MTEEEKYQKELEAAGVDVPGVTDKDTKEADAAKEKAEAEAKAKEDADAKLQEDADAKAKADAESEEANKNQPPKEDKKRSIYDSYKEKKLEAKTAAERAEKAEAEAAELRQKLADIETAKTPTEKKEAMDEFDEFAKEIEADPVALKKMRDLFLKGVKPDEQTQKDLLEFKQWKAENQKTLDTAAFEDEFAKTLPALKTFFPKASDEEMTAIKQELDKLCHSKGWNDKEMEYVAFKHKDTLGALVSPKRRGMESKENKEGDGAAVTDFDPNADYAKMTPTERATWEKQYREASKSSSGLIEGANGKRSII